MLYFLLANEFDEMYQFYIRSKLKQILTYERFSNDLLQKSCNMIIGVYHINYLENISGVSNLNFETLDFIVWSNEYDKDENSLNYRTERTS